MGLHIPPSAGVTAHTALTDKEVAGIIDHAALSVTDGKLASGVGLQDTQICKLPEAVLDEVLKRGAVAWEAGSIKETLEGDFTAWAVYDSHVDANLNFISLYDSFAVFNRDETRAYFVYLGVFSKPYTVATKTLGASVFTVAFFGSGAAVGFNAESVLGRYQVFVDTAEDQIRVVKAGVLIQSYNRAFLGLDAAQPIKSASISPTGKYIVIAADRVPFVCDGKWVILEGA